MHITRRIDLIVAGMSAVLLLGVIGYAQPLVISPIDGITTTNTSVLFAFSKADTILIDDNPDFSTPIMIKAEDNLVVRLEPGEYYWKVKGALESKTHTLTINSLVELMLRPNGDEYDVVNAGNTALNVEVYNGTEKVNEISLDADEETNSSGTMFVGSAQ